MDAESEVSLIKLLNNWLERMPFTQFEKYWQFSENNEKQALSFFNIYREQYLLSLEPAEMSNLEVFDMLFINEEAYPSDRRLRIEASKNALFIMLYPDYPILHLPYELLSLLLEIDEQLALWRYRHIDMVQRTIGKRIGTGGSTGGNYLKTAAEQHAIFKEIAELNSFLLPKNMVPKLPENLVKDLCYFKD